jgi:hypothetical protein
LSSRVWLVLSFSCMFRAYRWVICPSFQQGVFTKGLDLVRSSAHESRVLFLLYVGQAFGTRSPFMTPWGAIGAYRIGTSLFGVRLSGSLVRELALCPTKLCASAFGRGSHGLSVGGYFRDALHMGVALTGETRLRGKVLDFRRLGGPGRPGNPAKKVGGFAPTFLKGFPAAWGCPDPENQGCSFLIWPPLLVPPPCAST